MDGKKLCIEARQVLNGVLLRHREMEDFIDKFNSIINEYYVITFWDVKDILLKEFMIYIPKRYTDYCIGWMNQIGGNEIMRHSSDPTLYHLCLKDAIIITDEG